MDCSIMTLNPHLKFFFTLSNIDRNKTLRIIVFSLLYISGESIIPFIIRELIRSIEKKALLFLFLLSILILLVYSLIRAFWGLSDYEVSRFKIGVKGYFRKKIYEKLTQLSISDFNKFSKGELISRATSDIDIIGENSPLLPALFCAFLELIVLCFVLIKLNLFLALITIFTFPLYSIFEKKYKPKLEKESEKEREKSGSIVESIRETLEGVLTINIFNSQRYFIRIFDEKVKEWEKTAVKKMRYFYTYWGITSYMEYTLPVIILGVGSIMANMKLIDIPTLIAIFFLVGRVYIPVWNLNFLITTIPAAYPSVRRILEIINYKIDTRSEISFIPSSSKKIKFENVTFSYNGIENVLENLTLEIPLGKWTAIVGPTGSGKSTIFYILLGLYKPQKGNIYIEDEELFQCNSDEIRKKILYVANKDFIFNGSILQNLTLGETYSESEIKKIAEITMISEFTRDLEIDAKELSDGQKQRIALARALLRSPKILMLDEAMAPVDTKIEEIIFSQIKYYFPSLTVIIASHRLSTILMVDKIAVLKDGKIEAIGSHSELFKNCNYYKELIENQVIR
ncbi:MAG: ABC transporter ATP-binding protein/permease [Candidatus Omnitrophica bacterium]|nr:ABC transporter ATP-binding protein/permease [Candidatus Omnitrophota bacterium]